MTEAGSTGIAKTRHLWHFLLTSHPFPLPAARDNMPNFALFNTLELKFSERNFDFGERHSVFMYPWRNDLWLKAQGAIPALLEKSFSPQILGTVHTIFAEKPLQRASQLKSSIGVQAGISVYHDTTQFTQDYVNKQGIYELYGTIEKSSADKDMTFAISPYAGFHIPINQNSSINWGMCGGASLTYSVFEKENPETAPNKDNKDKKDNKSTPHANSDGWILTSLLYQHNGAMPSEKTPTFWIGGGYFFQTWSYSARLSGPDRHTGWLGFGLNINIIEKPVMKLLEPK